MEADKDVAGTFVFHRKGGLKVYDEKGDLVEPRDQPPAGKEMKKVGQMTIEFYEGSCWIYICDDSGCYWYYWSGPGCPV